MIHQDIQENEDTFVWSVHRLFAANYCVLFSVEVLRVIRTVGKHIDNLVAQESKDRNRIPGDSMHIYVDFFDLDSDRVNHTKRPGGNCK